MFFIQRTRELDKFNQYTTEQLKSVVLALHDSTGVDELMAYTLTVNELARRMGSTAFDHWATKAGVF